MRSCIMARHCVQNCKKAKSSHGSGDGGLIAELADILRPADSNAFPNPLFQYTQKLHLGAWPFGVVKIANSHPWLAGKSGNKCWQCCAAAVMCGLQPCGWVLFNYGHGKKVMVKEKRGLKQVRSYASAWLGTLPGSLDQPALPEAGGDDTAGLCAATAAA